MCGSQIKALNEESNGQLFDFILEMDTFFEYRYLVARREIMKIQIFKDQARQNEILEWVKSIKSWTSFHRLIFEVYDLIILTKNLFQKTFTVCRCLIIIKMSLTISL